MATKEGRGEPWWGWRLLAGCFLMAALAGYNAFSEPWDWTADQCFFVFFVLMVTAVSVHYYYILMRGGLPAVKAKWAAVKAMPDPEAQRTRKGWAFWLGVICVVIFALLSDSDIRQFLWSKLHQLN